MKRSEQVVAALNKNLEAELSAISKYSLQVGVLQNWGYSKLATKLKEIAKQEREHSEELIDRVVFLSCGLTRFSPVVTAAEPDVPGMLEANRTLENQAIEDYNKAANTACQQDDNGSRDLFTHILKEEENHLQFFVAQLRQIGQMGLDNYLSSQV